MGEVLVAPNYKEIEGPLIFLAGPIQGAPDWQAEAIDLIREKAPDINIASPRRQYTGKFTEKMWEDQTTWERHYLKRAGEEGAVLFWMANEVEPIPGRSYAQTTRVEFGQWSMHHVYKNMKLVVGIEKGFSGSKYVRKVLREDCPDVKLFDHLEDTCREAINLANFYK